MTFKKKFLSGKIKRHPDGFGFLIPDDPDHADVYIPRHSMEGVMTNDKVVIEVTPEKGGERFRGEILRISERGTKTVVGAFSRLNENTGQVKDEGKGWGKDLKIKITDSMNARDGQLVSVQILKYPDDVTGFWGKVTEIIGDIHDPLNDIKRVVLSNHIPSVFPEEVIRESRHFKEQPEESEFKNRVDLRNKNLITIDGATAKDFDDAVCVETNHEGFLLYVAIADVSHYVRIGSAIDKEAYQRGTSVYFPNFVVPMLPEILSNGLCSLNPHVARLCLVAEIQFDFTGNTLRSKFYEAVMNSKARVTYGEAQEVIDGVDVEKLRHVKDNILRCSDLAKILMAKRFKDGSVDLEIPETELEIDASGMPIDVIRSERLFSHRLIEELMLAANVAVATFLTSKKIPAMYRIHEPPNEQAIRLLEKYLYNFGGKTKLGTGKLQKRLSKALEEFEGRPEAEILHILTLRSMSQAKYSMNNVGHFGLGFEDYTHFTSPIRRYPDLIVHRLLKNQIMKNSPYRLMSEDDLGSAGTWLSACEQRSVKAERQIKGIKKARFMHKFVGQEFQGMISSVTRFGAFVLLREYDIDGLVKLEDLSTQHLEYDEESLCLVNHKTGVQFNIGDKIQIIVTAVDIESGQINFQNIDLLTKGKHPEVRSKEMPSKKNHKQFRHHERRAKEGSKHIFKESFKAEDLLKDVESELDSTSSDKPRLSKKLQFAEKSKLRLNVSYDKKTSSDRKNSKERRKTKNNSKRVRKTRVSQSGGKGKAR